MFFKKYLWLCMDYTFYCLLLCHLDPKCLKNSVNIFKLCLTRVSEGMVLACICSNFVQHGFHSEFVNAKRGVCKDVITIYEAHICRV